MINTKFAAHIGNLHATARVTPFFDTPAQARTAASRMGYDSTFVRECANWQEHQTWNMERIGSYAEMQVIE